MTTCGKVMGPELLKCIFVRDGGKVRTNPDKEST